MENGKWKMENWQFVQFVLPNLQFGSSEYKHLKCEKKRNDKHLLNGLQIHLLKTFGLQIRMDGRLQIRMDKM